MLVADKVTIPPVDTAAKVAAAPVVTPRTPEEIAQIASLMRTALGVDSARGDLMTVVSMPFSQPADVAPRDSMPKSTLMTRIENNPKMYVWMAALVGLLVLAIVMMLVLKPKKVTPAPQRSCRLHQRTPNCLPRHRWRMHCSCNNSSTCSCRNGRMNMKKSNRASVQLCCRHSRSRQSASKPLRPSTSVPKPPFVSHVTGSAHEHGRQQGRSLLTRSHYEPAESCHRLHGPRRRTRRESNRRMHPEEAEIVALEMAQLSGVKPELVDSVLAEWLEQTLAVDSLSTGGVEFAKEVLEKAFGTVKAAAILKRIQAQSMTRIGSGNFAEPTRSSLAVRCAVNIHKHCAYSRASRACPRRKYLARTGCEARW